MRKYPLNFSDFVTTEDIAAGRTYAKMPFEDYLQAVNNAFFSGFALASCETAEEFRSITTWERIKLCLAATQAVEDLYAYGNVSDSDTLPSHQLPAEQREDEKHGNSIRA